MWPRLNVAYSCVRLEIRVAFVDMGTRHDDRQTDGE